MGDLRHGPPAGQARDGTQSARFPRGTGRDVRDRSARHAVVAQSGFPRLLASVWGLDDTDRETLQLLLDDGRRPYSDIAETVNLSAPAVSDRVDRTMLREGVPVLVEVELRPGAGAAARPALAGANGVEHGFATVDDRRGNTLRRAVRSSEGGRVTFSSKYSRQFRFRM
ncbi:Lrp/AsnC family transcriptional regulator [Haloarculaceae archaeon H-GB2-1]|nr:Lrp/AsnC family transcriptional regulator [Haloarculaceae archaeon H-GB1-1]MEA5407846.1 Lrp/AsnC family transcriptional regulator [Haloarculaceae archaeon H-GB2-1]